MFYKFLPSVTSRNCIQLQQIMMKDGIAHVYEILQFYKLSHITSTLLQQKMCVTLNVDNKTQKRKQRLIFSPKKNKSKKPNIKLPREAVACKVFIDTKRKHLQNEIVLLQI